MRNTGEICAHTLCPEGCDRGCEKPATWTPVVGVEQFTYGPGAKLVHDGKGGGVLMAKAKGKSNPKINRRVGSVVPFRGETETTHRK